MTIFDTNNNIFVNKTTIFSVPTQQWSTISILWEKVKTRGIWSLFSILAWFTIWFEVSNVKPMKEIQREMFVLVQEIAGYYIYIWLGFTGSERGVLKANILSHRQSKQLTRNNLTWNMNFRGNCFSNFKEELRDL